MNPDVKLALDGLRKEEDKVVKDIVDAIKHCAAGSSKGSYWWLGAQQLCKLLSQIGTASARDALVAIAKMDSRVIEFDGVRTEAARQLGIQTIHAPGSPDEVIETGRQIEDPQEALQYFSKHESDVKKWPRENRAGFYYFYGKKVERIYGKQFALPFFAASLVADSGRLAAAWSYFADVKPTPENARKLVAAHPVKDPVSRFRRFAVIGAAISGLFSAGFTLPYLSVGKFASTADAIGVAILTLIPSYLCLYAFVRTALQPGGHSKSNRCVLWWHKTLRSLG
ncbi:hypothetical protein L0222_00845 [bacterium]|nr:hypothetical protein [bacterium]